MTSNPLENAVHSSLNDRRIFSVNPELINKTDWSKFREALSKADNVAALQIIQQSKERVAERIKTEEDSRQRKRLERGQKLLESLKTKVEKAPTKLSRILVQIDSFGFFRCELPNMEDYGSIIEGHSRPMVEEFFLYKIQKEWDQWRKPALQVFFEIVQELYDLRVEPLEIAFFVRKIDSLSQIIEVLV